MISGLGVFEAYILGPSVLSIGGPFLANSSDRFLCCVDEVI